MDHWFILSERGLPGPGSHVAWPFNYEFEDLLCRLTAARILAPEFLAPLKSIRRAPVIGRPLSRFLGKVADRYTSVELPARGPGKRILFVTTIAPYGLKAVEAISDWRKEFDLVLGYVVDAFPLPAGYPEAIVKQYDHLFVSVPERVEILQKGLGIPVTPLPLACDVVRFGSGSAARSIDVLAYGRQRQSYIKIIDEHFLAERNRRLYLSGFSHSRESVWMQTRLQFWQVARSTRISLAFAPDSSELRFEGLPAVTGRWFEGLTAGCLMVGKPPDSPFFRQWFDWTDACVDLPDDPSQAPDFIESLLDDPHRLHAAHARNYRTMLQRHDWRHRIAQIMQATGLNPPETLVRELAVLPSLQLSNT